MVLWTLRVDVLSKLFESLRRASIVGEGFEQFLHFKANHNPLADSTNNGIDLVQSALEHVLQVQQLRSEKSTLGIPW